MQLDACICTRLRCDTRSDEHWTCRPPVDAPVDCSCWHVPSTPKYTVCGLLQFNTNRQNRKYCTENRRDSSRSANAAYLRRDSYRDDSSSPPITARRGAHQSAAKPDWHPDPAPGKPQLPNADSIPARFLSKTWTNWFNPGITRLVNRELMATNWRCSTRIQRCFITPPYNAAYLTNPPDFFSSFLSVSELKSCIINDAMLSFLYLLLLLFSFFFSSFFSLSSLP